MGFSGGILIGFGFFMGGVRICCFGEGDKVVVGGNINVFGLLKFCEGVVILLLLVLLILWCWGGGECLVGEIFDGGKGDDCLFDLLFWDCWGLNVLVMFNIGEVGWFGFLIEVSVFVGGDEGWCDFFVGEILLLFLGSIGRLLLEVLDIGMLWDSWVCGNRFGCGDENGLFFCEFGSFVVVGWFLFVLFNDGVDVGCFVDLLILDEVFNGSFIISWVWLLVLFVVFLVGVDCGEEEIGVFFCLFILSLMRGCCLVFFLCWW